jgi:uncharacterized membrane protein YwzB
MLLLGLFPSIEEIHDFFFNIIHIILLFIDCLVYSFVGYLYELFELLSTFNPFTIEMYEAFATRVYTILGVVMLFILIYNLLQGIINPDDTLKKDSSPQKFLLNIVISIIIIAVLPTLFEFITSLQYTILDNNVIQNIVFGNTDKEGGCIDSQGHPIDCAQAQHSAGNEMAVITFSSFFQVTEEWCAHDEAIGPKSDDQTTDEYLQECQKVTYDNKAYTDEDDDKISLYEIKRRISSGASFFNLINYSKRTFSPDSGEKKKSYYPIHVRPISHMFPISTVAGVFLCYVLVSFCFDLGKRVVKLLFLQIIAPIPAICRALPQAKDVFSNWVKLITAVYLEVFVRVIAITFGVFLINQIMGVASLWEHFAGHGFFTMGFAKAFVIMGIVAFIKELPKFLGNLFPAMNSDNMSLGIKDKLKAGGAFAAGAAVGGGITSGVRNGIAAFKGKKNWQNKDGKVTAGSIMRNLGRGIGSTIAGTTSGTRYGLMKGANAGSVSEMKQAASDAATKTQDKRLGREARHDRYKANKNPFTRTAIGGKIADIGTDIKEWATGGVEQFDRAMKNAEEYAEKFDKMQSAATSVTTKFRRRWEIVPQDEIELRDNKVFKGSDEEIAAMVAQMAQIKASHGGHITLADVDKELEQLQKGVDVSTYQKTVTKTVLDHDAFAAAQAAFVAGGSVGRPPQESDFTKAETVVEFDEAGYQAAVRENQAAKIAVENLKDQLEKATNAAIINATQNQANRNADGTINTAAVISINGTTLTGITADNLLEVNGEVENFVQAHKMRGNKIVDETTVDPATGKPIEVGDIVSTAKVDSHGVRDVAGMAKKATDAAKHNRDSVKRKTAEMEARKAAREQEKGKK